MWTELFQLAIRNLGRARARLIMTAGGVVVGTSAVILLVALTYGLQNAAEAGIGSDASLTQIDVYPMWGETGSTSPELNDETIVALWQIPNVQAVVPRVMVQSGEMHIGKYSGYASFIGIDPRILPYMGLTVAEGELSLERGQAIAGYAISQNFYDPKAEEWTPIEVDLMAESPVELLMYSYTGATRDEDLNFTGRLAEGNGFYDYVVFIPMEQAIEWNEWITDQEYDPETFVYNEVTVIANSREAVKGVSNAIKEMGFGTGGLGGFLDSLNGFFETMRLMLGAVGSVALLVAAFGVANTMMMAILERTREIGIMKAIGATNETILTLFLLEAGLVGLAGGVVGVLLANGLANVANNAIQNLPQSDGGIYFLPIDPTQIGGQLLVIPSELTWFAIVLATLVGIIAGIYPAWRAAQMPPVIALKHD